MDRLTTDNPQNNMESAHNIFSIKNQTTVCSLTEDGHEITLYDLMRHCSEVLHCRVSYDSGTDDDIGEFLFDNLFDGCDSPEGILAHFYTTAWAYSELREKLKAYEDSGFEPDEINRRAEPENKLLTLPSVSDRDRQSMYDFLHDCFAEWVNDPSVGLIGMNQGEATLANAIKDALAACKPEESSQQQLCSEDENFIQTKFGYCFYTLNSNPWIYNLYVHPKYRRCGHSKKLLKLVIDEIRKSGYEGKIRIQAEPREDSIGLVDLTKYYKSMGLVVCEANRTEEK